MHTIVNMYQFKHLLCSLCSIVNKISAHVILNDFSFNFIQKKKKTSQHIWNSTCRRHELTVHNYIMSICFVAVLLKQSIWPFMYWPHPLPLGYYS